MEKNREKIITDMVLFLDDIEKYLEEIGHNEEKFFEWWVYYDAIMLKLALIWEWWVQLQDTNMKDISSFPFTEMRWLRNRIIHDYLWVNDEIIWDALLLKRKELRKALQDLL